MKQVLFKTLRKRFLLENSKIIFPVRLCSHEHRQLTLKNSVQKTEEENNKITEVASFGGVIVDYWNETVAIRRQRKIHKQISQIKNFLDLTFFFQNFNNFPTTLSEFVKFLRRKHVRMQLAEQEYLPKRIAVLKPDLAAAHFICYRKGSVKFFGKSEWIGLNEKNSKLPSTYMPGLFIESIKAEGTELYYEGLPNLGNLRYLTFLSLKNLKTMNDWCMDWISKEYYLSLRHLDISGCENVTYRGLSCFYRFECLETLNVENIPDTPEFKLACLMLLDIMPNLDIQGIDLTIPEKIEAVNENKQISDAANKVQELKT